MLAKAFGTSREVKEVESIIRRNKIQGHTNHKDIKWMFQNIGKYFYKVRQGEEVKEGKIYPVMNQGQRKKIIKIANKHSGDMEKAIKQIEKLKKGITDNPAVMDILRKANESKDNEVKQESKKYHETKPGSLQDAVGQVLKVEG
tara:strand:- start:925 stop:1356 length:432 start_codon:yes stop_codon:yes gene_type:complete